jgi:chlorobactene glucosyltransferase
MAFLIQHEWSLVGFFVVLFAIAISNLWGIPRLKSQDSRGSSLVSILIPMRDEGDNAAEVVACALGQDYPKFEVIVHEEGSQDNTCRVLERIDDEHLSVIHKESPPCGWLGKPWACHNLAKAAHGELLIFLDADVRLSPKAVSSAVAELERKHLDLLSLLPHQITRTLGELLVVSIIPWALSSFFPLILVRLFGIARITATVGQFVLISREAYRKIGGHASVRDRVLEDIELGKLAVSSGLSAGLGFGDSLVRCRMYSGLRTAINGLSKNLFAVFGRRLGLFAFVWTYILYTAWQPIIVILTHASAGVGRQDIILPALLTLSLSSALWAFSAVRFRINLILAVLFPLVSVISWVIAVRSAFWHLTGRGTWKGKSIHVTKGAP